METALLVVGVFVPSGIIGEFYTEAESRVHWVINKLVAFSCRWHTGHPFSETIFVRSNPTDKFPKIENIRYDRIRYTIFETVLGNDIFSSRIHGDTPDYQPEVWQLDTYLKDWEKAERIAICGIFHGDDLVKAALSAKNLFGSEVFIVEDGIAAIDPEKTKEILIQLENSGIRRTTSEMILREWCVD